MSDHEDLLAAVLGMKNDVGYIKGKVESIEEQTKKTNGRVTKSEARINYVIVALAALIVLLAAINPSFDKILNLLLIK